MTASPPPPGWSRSPAGSAGTAWTSSRATRRSRPRPAYGPALRAAGFRADRGDPAVAPPDLAAARPGHGRRDRLRGPEQVDPPADRGRGSRRRVRVARYDLGGAPDDDVLFEAPAESGRRRARPLLRAARDRRAAPLPLRAARRVRRLVAGRPRPRLPRLPRGPLPRRAGRRPRGRRPGPLPARRPALDGPLGRPRRAPPDASRGSSTCSAGGRSSSRSARVATRWTSAASTSARRHREPAGDDPMSGLYEHKRSFGARWVELTGAHERVLRSLAVRRGAARRPGRRGGPAMTDAGRTIAERLADAEPGAPARLDGLIDRLTAPAGCAARGSTAGRSARAASPPSRSAASPTTRATVQPGALFVAIAGGHVDGHDFVARAAEAGAAAAIVERPLPEVALPQLVVDRSQPAVAVRGRVVVRRPEPRAGRGRDHRHGRQDDDLVPRRRPRSRRPASGPGWSARSSTRIGGTQEPNEEHATTPDAPRLQAALRAMVAGGDRAAVIETTSHGLALERVGGIAYDVAILTNVSHEHLEFHGTFEAYRRRQALPVRAARPRAGAAAPSPRASAGRGRASSTSTTRWPAASSG